MRLEAKAERLRSILRHCGRIALAFSGGADSSLLLKCALDTLGVGNVLVLFARSELLTDAEINRALHWPEDHGYARGVEMEVLHLQPLGWKEFVANEKERCYFCKRRIYSLFHERMEQRGMRCLVDGTNADDLKTYRAGLRAIHELNIRMPLVEAGFDKAEVRALSRELGLATWDRPSASCLATRIPTGLSITGERLRRIAILEAGLEQFGLVGSRVRLRADRPDSVQLEVRMEDFAVLANTSLRMALVRYFHQHAVEEILLNLEGRP